MVDKNVKYPFGEILKLDKRKKWPKVVKIEFEETK